MTDELLKKLLPKVQQLKGQKSYSFGYVVGKRKDGAGEGHLELNASRKLPKKEDLAGQVQSVQSFVAGRCWGNSEGTVLYFAGKGVNERLVGLISKTVKKLVKEYDIQLPSEAEDQRQQQLEASAPSEPDVEGAPPESSVPAAPPTPPGAARNESAPSADAVMKRLNALTEDIKAAMAGPNKAAVQTRFVAVNALMKKGDYAGANATLNELEGLVKGPRPMEGDGKAPQGDGKLSLVKLGKARIEWGQLTSKAIADIGTMMELIEEEFADYTDQKTELANAKKRVEGLIADLKDELSPALDNVLNGQDDNQRKPLIERAKGILAKYVKIVQSDPIMTKLDGNEVMPEMKVCAPMQGKLQEIAAALG